MEYFLMAALLIAKNFLGPSLQKLLNFLCCFINIREEIVQSLVHPDIDIDGNMDRLYLNRRHLYLAPGLHSMLRAAESHEEQEY